MAHKIAAFLFCILVASAGFANAIPERTRQGYALKFHEAFILQSIGQSTNAFNRFFEAFCQGTEAGESAQKLQVVANMFYWYRQHGSCMQIFGKYPSYRERIDKEYCVCGQRHQYREGSSNFRAKQIVSGSPHQPGGILARVPDYQSEYGVNPRQAATVREFMFGIGEIIAGVFTCTTSPYWGVGIGLVSHGGYLIGSSLHSLWTEHEVAMWELKKLTNEAEALSK